MKISFYLVGKCDMSNPSSIPLSMIEQWQDEGLITYFGEQEDVRPLIGESTCVVLPSYREGIPRALLEAMSMGKPIITTNAIGCKECILNPHKQNQLQIGENGILVPTHHPKILAYAMQTMINFPREKKEKMGQQGRQLCKQRFEITHTIHTYTQAILHYAPIQNSNLVFISNTSFAMYNFRLPVLLQLQNMGYQIHIIAPKDSSTEKLQNQGFILHDITINPKGLNPLEDLIFALRLRKILKKICPPPSLVFNYTIKPAIYGSLLCRFLKIPHISIITGLGYVFIDEGIKKAILKTFVSWLYRIALSKAKEVWFLNTQDQEFFLSHHLLSIDQAKLLDSEGIDTHHFSPQPSTKQNEIVFLLIARMLWDKGIGDFIEAIKILKNKI